MRKKIRFDTILRNGLKGQNQHFSILLPAQAESRIFKEKTMILVFKLIVKPPNHTFGCACRTDCLQKAKIKIIEIRAKGAYKEGPDPECPNRMDFCLFWLNSDGGGIYSESHMDWSSYVFLFSESSLHFV